MTFSWFLLIVTLVVTGIVYLTFSYGTNRGQNPDAPHPVLGSCPDCNAATSDSCEYCPECGLRLPGAE